MKPRLKLEVEGLHKGPIDFEFDVAPEEFDLVGDHEFEFTQNVAGKFVAKFVGGENVALIGRLTTRARAACVRCLVPLEYPLDLKIETVFMPRPSRLDEDTDPLEAEKLFYEGGVIYPMERLREEIMLQLPFFPSCELQNERFCPVRGVEVDPTVVFGADEEAEPKPEPSAPAAHESAASQNSWKDQLAKVRKKMDSGN